MAWDIDKILRTKQQRLAMLEGANLDDDDPQLKELRRDIPVLQLALQVLRDTRRRENPRRGTVGELSNVGVARDILDQAKKPMHVDDIVREMEARGYPAKKRALTSRLAKLVSQGNIFERVGPGMFGLIDWRKTGHPLVPRVERTEWNERAREGRNVRLLKQNRRP